MAINFQQSYLFWTVPPEKTTGRHMPWGNSARIELEARCELRDERAGAREEYWLIAACRTEYMYRESGLLQMPNREYRVVTSRTEDIRVAGAILAEPRRLVRKVDELWTEYELTVNTFPKVTPLADEESVIAATLANLPLVAQTEFRSEAIGLSAILEYPVRTMNINREWKRFQVDTGPLAYPDLETPDLPWIERFTTAFAVYNTFNSVEFIVYGPTPLEVEGRPVATVMDYQKVETYQATHRLFAGGSMI